DLVEKVARKIHGGGGPGGSNSEQWTDFLLRFGRSSHRVRDAVAQLCCKLNNQSVSWDKIQALMSSRLIALDKCPGVRPIGIGECLRRILSKCMLEITGDDVTNACGKDQLRSGLKGGIEGAVHAMSTLFRSKSSPDALRWNFKQWTCARDVLRVRDVLGELCEKAWGNTVKEPIINEDGPGLRGDLAVRGVWEAQREALFDIRVVDTDAPSHASRTVRSVLISAEEEKKRKYLAACEQRHATFYTTGHVS
ncbi:hypothetical protein WDU94_013938, partial [Cyamophila willieti]